MMKKVVKYVGSMLLFLLISSGMLAQDEIVYQHPTLGIQFTASPNWVQVRYSGENTTYELVNQNNNMHMKLWFEKTESSIVEFLRNKVCKEGMVDEETFVTRLDNQEAYGICAICSKMRRPYKVMLIAIPEEDGIYLLRFRCPEECYMEHHEQIQNLLKTVTFNPVVERTVYYAANN